jgi:serine/threonine protein kinase
MGNIRYTLSMIHRRLILLKFVTRSGILAIFSHRNNKVLIWNETTNIISLAKSFFLKMMNTDPVIRYRAEDALKHPWITRKFDDPIPLSGHEVMSNFSLEQTFTRVNLDRSCCVIEM